MSFWCLQFSQKSNENNSTWGTLLVKSNFFLRFLEELKIPKRHFEINWPLADAHSAYLAVGIICPPPRWIGSFATMASRILNLQLRMGSSQSGPSLTPHWNPCTMESLTEPSRPLSTSDGSVSSTNMLGPGKKINPDGLIQFSSRFCIL